MSDLIPIPFGSLILRLPKDVVEAALAEALAHRHAGTPPVATEPELVDIQALSQRLSIPEGWLEAAAREGRIPSIKVGDKYRRYSVAAVLAALTETNGADRAAARSQKSSSRSGRLR